MPSSDCVLCENEGTFECSVCHSVRYCSTKCQNNDKQVHDLLCKKYANHPPTPRPVPADRQYVLGIHFNRHSSSPGFVWVSYRLEGSAKVLDLNKFLTNNDGELRPMGIGRDLLLRKPLQESIGLWFKTWEAPDDPNAVPNKAIQSLNINHSQPFTWNADLLAVQTKNDHPENFADVTMEQVRYLAD